MALALRIPENGGLKIGGTPCVVSGVKPDGSFTLTVDGPAFKSIFSITNRARVQIMPGVHVSAGPRRDGAAVINIEAPRSIKVLRDGLVEH